MRPIYLVAIFLAGSFLNFSSLNAQQDSSDCKVTWQDLAGSYIGGCKNGLAEGKGEAKGLHHYIGSFKNGMPNGSGVYYYSDTVYHSGNFQDGLKEGKGETHYFRKAMSDSVIRGYWSGDEFRGTKYITYNFSTTDQFDLTDITPSKNSGNTITIEIGTTSGSPNSAQAGNGNGGYVLTLRDLVSPTGSIVKVRSKYESAFKSYITFELVGFPCKLFGTLSDNRTFELELYKAADWKARFFKNK